MDQANRIEAYGLRGNNKVKITSLKEAREGHLRSPEGWSRKQSKAALSRAKESLEIRSGPPGQNLAGDRAHLPCVFVNSTRAVLGGKFTLRKPGHRPSKLRLTRRRRQPLLIYSFLPNREHGGWQEQEIVQGQEGIEEENRPLREEGLVLRQGPLHLRRQRVRQPTTHTPRESEREKEKSAGKWRTTYTNNRPVSARPSSTAPPV